MRAETVTTIEFATGAWSGDDEVLLADLFGDSTIDCWTGTDIAVLDDRGSSGAGFLAHEVDTSPSTLVFTDGRAPANKTVATLVFTDEVRVPA
ncbi:hypothetical protein [Rhodoplanes roseus]|uniref:Uncharacterized protein n=1 Tax=Rhodoplanes roseus TaxID=29409 RepID=A0A327KS73_9BRAD|nr:hypothetical protein [Rhodoplanes roseus]RAI40215.1 hypothetical protein CH341_24215 [Rhodoplanes roseus]